MWFWWALTTAIISSISYVLSKYVVDKTSTLVTTWALFSLNIPILIGLVLFQNKVEINQWFWLGIIVSGGGFIGVKAVTMLAMKRSKISKIMPLNVVSVVLAYLTALIMLKETLGWKELLGLGLIIGGIYWINLEKAKESWLAPIKELKRHKASLMYLIAIMFAGAISSFDKLAIMNTNPHSPELVLLGENIIGSVLLGLMLIKRSGFGWLKEVGIAWKRLSLLSVIYLLSLLAVFHGFSNGPVALVLGIKKLQILFAMLWAWWFLKDKPKKEQLGGAIVMIVGAMLLKM